MTDATEIGRKLAEAAEEAAKSMQRLADVLREAEKEADSDKFWKFNLEHEREIAQHFDGMTPEERMKTLLPRALVDVPEARSMSDKEREEHNAYTELFRRYKEE